MYLKQCGSVVLMALLLNSPITRADDNQTSMSELAVTGGTKFAVCQSCHDASLNPPKAPPMFGVQRRYKKQYASQQEFVDAVVQFVSQPTDDGALMKGPVRKLGLMPGLPLGDDMLSEIAAYIYEESFEPPCEHWAHALSSGKGKGKHRQHVQGMYEEFCK